MKWQQMFFIISLQKLIDIVNRADKISREAWDSSIFLSQ